MSQITDRYVISLAGSRRLEPFMAQPAAAGFAVWDAFDGRSGAGQDQFDADAFRDRYGRSPLGGEIGCTLSHHAVLAHFAAQPGADDDLMLVAEDDAVFSDDADLVISTIARRGIRGWALLGQPLEDPRFAPFWAKSRNLTHLSLLARPVGPWTAPWRYRLGHAEGEIHGAGLYLVTRAAARALTSHGQGVSPSWVADDYIGWHAAAGVDMTVLRPTVCGWLGDSEINPASRPHLDLDDYTASQYGRQAWARRWARFKAGARCAWRQDVRRAAG